MCDVVYNKAALIEALIAQLEEFTDRNGIDNMRKEGQSVWNAFLMTVAPTVKAMVGPFYLSVKKNESFYGVKVDYEKLYNICDVYIYLCALNNKEVSVYGFSKFVGMNEVNFYNFYSNDRAGANVHAEMLLKTLNTANEESLTNLLTSSGRNPVGVLAILNRRYRWNEGGVPVDSDRAALTAQELPHLRLNDGNEPRER